MKKQIESSTDAIMAAVIELQRIRMLLERWAPVLGEETARELGETVPPTVPEE